MADPRISAEDLAAAVRVHADRVHDFLRRTGCSPRVAVEVLEASATDLVAAAVRSPGAVRDVVGWWFGRAGALGAHASVGTDDLPLGGGLLSADHDQALISESLELLPERERVAVLLCDSYALSPASVGVALGTDADAAMETVARGRLRFLQAVGDELPTTSGHVVDLGALARLGLGGPVAARDATPRRHAQSCPTCRAVWDTQERAHRLLSGLTVIALPEAEREQVLARFDDRARAALPGVAVLLEGDDAAYGDEGPRRLLSPLYVVTGLLLAILVGAVVGILLSRSGSSGRAVPAALVTSSPAVSTSPPPPATSAPVTVLPSPVTPSTPGRLFTLAPSPSASASADASPTGAPEAAAERLTLARSPTSGPNGSDVTVSGTGWLAGGTVRIDYLNPLGVPTGAGARQAVDVRGRFTTALSALDPANLPGRHTIRAADGKHTLTTTYDVSG